MTFEIKRPAWVTDSLVKDRGPYAGFQMYSREGNDAVADMLLGIADAMESHQMSHDNLRRVLKLGIEHVEQTHPEVFDTEPRGAILDVMDDLCEAYGIREIESIS